MSILIVQGPQAPALPALPVACAELDVRACRCGDVAQLARALHRIDAGRVRLVLLEPGPLPARIEPGQACALRDALDTLAPPYIEWHDDAMHELEPRLHPHHAPLAVVISPHDRAGGYALSLRIAMRRLADAA